MENGEIEEKAKSEDAAPFSEEKPTLRRVMFFSLFIVPLFIAVIAVALFTGVCMLAMDDPDPLALLEDVRHGYANKRWQAAYHLVTMLDGPNAVELTPELSSALVDAFRSTDPVEGSAVRQYLALAMGCAGGQAFVKPLLEALDNDPAENTPYIIRALGRLGDSAAEQTISSYINNADALLRLESVIALGAIGAPASRSVLRAALNDAEPNVRWDAAIALAKMGDDAGQDTLLQLLDRRYFSDFEAVDDKEVNRILQVSIQAAAMLHRPSLDAAIRIVAANDENMDVRRTASRVLNGSQQLMGKNVRDDDQAT